MSFRTSRLWLSLVLSVLPAASSVLYAQAPAVTPAAPAVAAGAGDELVGPIKLRDESLEQVLSLLQMWTGRSIIRPQALPATTYTLTIDRKLPKSEAVRALETLLTLNQIGVTEMGGDFLKIVPLGLVKTEAPPMIEGSTLDLPPSGKFASKLFQLQFLRVNEVIPQLQPLLNPAAGGGVVVFEKANAALVTDSVSNLQRIETLLDQLDKPATNGLHPKFYSIHFAKASDVVAKLRGILNSPSLQSQLGTGTTYTADDRTNQVILLCDPRQQPLFDGLIAKLDVRADPNTRTEVIYLKHATAKDVATLLSQLVAGQTSAAKASDQTSVRPGQVTLTSGQVTMTTAPAPNLPAGAQNLLGSTPSEEFSSLLTILSDDRSNALVVSGTVDDLRLISELVDKLDVLLAQVRIEVVIAEIDLNASDASGIDQLGLQISGDKLVGFNASGFGNGLTIGGPPASGASAASGLATLTRNPLSGSLDLGALVQLAAARTKSDVSILSVPTIVTTHNKKASIFVGETQPVISGYVNNGTSTVNNGQVVGGFNSTVTQQQIGITLTVTPLIGDDGSVQLDISQQVSSVGGSVTIDGNQQPIVNERTTTSFVTVKSGDTIVLGGMQQNQDTLTHNRLAFLGQIPIIGGLFGSRTKSTQRTDLLFFLRPYVLTNTPADNAEALKRIDDLPQKEEVYRAINPDYQPPKAAPSAPAASLQRPR